MKKRLITLIMTCMMSIMLTACEGKQTISDDNDEYSDEFILEAARDMSPGIDISGCDTFTQIVDRKLTAGMGYANAKIGSEDALLVCSNAYDDMNGNMYAVDATVFIYKDGVPYEAGSVCSAGTAYPLVERDGTVYSGSNHWVCKYSIEDDRVVVNEKVVTSDDVSMQKLFDEMCSGEVINFDVIR